MGRAWSSASSWPGFLDVSAVGRHVADSLSRLWPSPPNLSSVSPSRWWWWWPPFDFQLDLSVLDSLLWPVVVAVESVALASMLCCFFLFCGCNL